MGHHYSFQISETDPTDKARFPGMEFGFSFYLVKQGPAKKPLLVRSITYLDAGKALLSKSTAERFPIPSWTANFLAMKGIPFGRMEMRNRNSSVK
jgi:hypothetical protein